MKTRRATLDKKEQILLKSLIGTKLLSLKHQSLWTDTKTSPKIGILTEKGIVSVDIKDKKIGDLFGPKIEFPELQFYPVQKEEDLDINREIADFRSFPVHEVIEDILLVDEIVPQKDGSFLESTEGILLKTPAIEYAFCKAKPMQGKDIQIFADSDVLPELKPLYKRWPLLAKEDTTAQRKLISLSDNEEKK